MFGFHDDSIMIKVPSIITMAQWRKVKQIQEDRWKEKTRNNHLLAGLVKCGHCGMSCSILKTKYGRYYRCNGKYSEVRGEGITCPGSPYANADKLEALIWNMIVSWARNPGQVLQEFIGQNSDMLGKLAEIREGIAEADAAVVKCQEQLERAVYGYTTEVLSLDELS